MAVAPGPRPRTLVSDARLARGPARLAYRALVAVTVALSTLVFVGPLYWLASGGFKSAEEMASSPPTLVPEDPDPTPYVQAWTQLGLGQALLNTVYYAAGALVFCLVLDVAAAYSLSRLRPRLGNLVLGMMLAMLMVPATVLVVPQYVTVADLPLVHVGLIDTPWAIWLPAVANAFNVVLLKRFFDSIPRELLDAAAVDGAGPVRTLVSVVVPISRPVLGVVSIFVVTSVWKDFLWPMLVETLQNGKETVNVAITAQSAGVGQNVVVAAAALAAVPTLVVFLVLQRHILAGLGAGALKG